MSILLGILEALDLLGNLACAPFTYACAIAGAIIGYWIGGGGLMFASGAAGGIFGLWLDLGAGAMAQRLRWPVGIGLAATAIVIVMYSIFTNGH